MTNAITANLLQEANQAFNQGDFQQSLSLANQILAVDPINHDGLVIKANSFSGMKKMDKATPAFEEVIKHYPDNHTVLLILLVHYTKEEEWEKLLPIALKAIHFPDCTDAFMSAIIALHAMCEWDILDKLRPIIIDKIRNVDTDPIHYQQFLFSLIAFPDYDEEDIFNLHQAVASRFMDSAAGKQYWSYQQAEKKLKIGYLSGDLNLHPVGLFVQRCVELHNRDHFEVYCYADLVREDALTDKFRNIADHFIEVTEQPDDQVAKRIHDDGIDILIDLGGFTGRVLLGVFAYKPAPVQISYCGYPYSTGLPTIDYRITDPHAEGKDQYYSEELIYMPETFLCMGDGYESSFVSDAPCEENGYITFGSFNDLRKINTPVIRLWSRILQAVPNSKFLIRSRKMNDFMAERINKQFEKFGIDKERLIFVSGILSYAEHARYYKDIDIILDVFPFCGATTSLETLWNCVPIVTLVGEAHRQRPTYTMLKNIGFTEGVAFSEDEYVEKAVALANRPAKGLSIVRHCLYTLTRSSILFQPETFTHQLDSLLIDAWNRKMDDHRSIETIAPEYSYAFPLVSSKENEDKVIHKLDDHEDKTVDLILSDGLHILLPNNINFMTPYVVSEQQGWFESEIQFIRRFLQAGMKAIDIGACYGTYALPMAKKVESSGYVWAFEPTPTPNKLLKKSSSHNNLTNISVINVAVSDKKGEAPLNMDGNCELNSLQYLSNSLDLQVLVETHPLDQLMEEHNWDSIDFIKIDTESDELNILAGGKDFFTNLSPLVLYACKDKDVLNTELINKFEQLGYNTYMLIPGINTLSPFDPEEMQDSFLLNLFACKSDRAEKLQKAGLLSTGSYNSALTVNEHAWESYLEQFHYSQSLVNDWKAQYNNGHKLPGSDIYRSALNLYVNAHAETSTPDEKVASLRTAFIQLVSLLDLHVTLPRLQTLIRVAIELGKRDIAIQLLNDLINNLHETGSFQPDEPFLAISKEAEEAQTGNSLAGWCLAYATAEREIQSAFSSYFSDGSSLETLKVFKELEYPHEEMNRRLMLMNKRFG